jgi:glycosyltransferase involved in cell wall biosynthesis
MIANFLNSNELYQNFEVSFSYRKSDRYEAGLNKRVIQSSPREHYPVLSGTFLIDWSTRLPKPLTALFRIFNYIFLIRCWVFSWNIFILSRAWKSKKIEVLHINNGGYPGANSCLAASVAAKIVGIPCVIMVVNNIAAPSILYWWQDLFINSLVKKNVSLFVTGSLMAKKALQSFLKLSDQKLRTLHNGIAPRELTETKAQTRARLKISDEALVFGIVALLEKRKGHHVLIKAVSKLATMIPQEQMPLILIEGDGPEKLSLFSMAERLKVGQWVRFIGNETHIFNFMQSLDLVLLPSVANEDFPNVILEGMSLGKPVIASRIAGTPEQIENGVTGWLVEPGDSTQLAEKMAFFIQNKPSMTIMGVEAQRRFQSEFTAAVSVSRYIKLYQSLIQQ